MGWEDVGNGGYFVENQEASAAAPTKGRRVGPGSLGTGHSEGDYLGPAQALSLPHSPEGETQLHRGGVPDAQNSWPPVGGHPRRWRRCHSQTPPLRHNFQGWTHLAGPQVPSES